MADDSQIKTGSVQTAVENSNGKSQEQRKKSAKDKEKATMYHREMTETQMLDPIEGVNNANIALN